MKTLGEIAYESLTDGVIEKIQWKKMDQESRQRYEKAALAVVRHVLASTVRYHEQDMTSNERVEFWHKIQGKYCGYCGGDIFDPCPCGNGGGGIRPL